MTIENFKNRLNEISPEVIYSDGGFLAADDKIISILKEKARESPRRRCRLCFHDGPDAPQQEMLIAMHQSSYVRPHRHFGKAETLTIVEGHCDALLFDERGNVTNAIPMSSPGHGVSFFYRMPEGIFHTLVFRSEWLIFLETTIGPFDRVMTEAAAWAPDELTASKGHAFLAGLPLPTT